MEDYLPYRNIMSVFSTKFKDHNHIAYCGEPGADPESLDMGGELMASAEREPNLGVWGLCPQWGPGAKPLVRRPEADEI
jgi:hypothetical protein